MNSSLDLNEHLPYRVLHSGYVIAAFQTDCAANNYVEFLNKTSPHEPPRYHMEIWRPHNYKFNKI